MDNLTFQNSAAELLSEPIIDNITVYAKWVPAPFTITFNTNYGSSLAPITLTFGEEIPWDSFNPEKEGFNFHYWYTPEYGDIFGADTMPVMPAQNLVLYADWLPNNLRLTI